MKADPIPPCGTCNQAAATGFIRLKACVPPGGIAAKVQREK
jgi:hypothetical protein